MRVVIIGSGIVGASCAYTACSLGAEVVLADAALPGQATAAGAGIVCPWWSEQADDSVWYDFACAAARYYPELVAGLAPADVSYRQVGALVLAHPDQRQAVMDSFLGAVTVTGRAELVRRGDRAAGVTVGGELIEADAVVAAAGAWTNAFLPPGAVTVEPQRGQIAHLSVESADTAAWPVVLPAGKGHYLVAFGDHRVVAGATRETGSGFDYRVTGGGLSQVLREALAMAPGLAAATYLETRVGFRPMSPDGRPVLGPVPGTDGLVVATGLGPTGLTMGPYAGAIAARVALGEQPGADLAPFSPLRSAS